MITAGIVAITKFQSKAWINSIALRMAKTVWSFGRSECNRLKEDM